MVIASGGWTQHASDCSQEKNMSATGILICHDNSYPFQERTLSLEQPIKIGRSVARARAAGDNAIFDCKVLSRNHALLWYDSGKFFLKDTKSSNGTFVNNKRLSPSGEESIACEVSSGDVVQFGVDVVESTKKVTHGCIIATLKLYLPDGKEAKASFSNTVTYVNVTLEDLYKLNQFIQEAGRRENALRSKLEYMQQLLEHTRIAANQSWRALVVEDCLLSRLEMLESQIVAYSKNFGEDKLRIELLNLLEDKAQYQNATKELLQKKVQEKREIIGKVQILKCRLNETEEETQSLHNVIRDNQNELQELAIKYIKAQQTLQDTTEKLNKTKIKLKDVIQQSESDKQNFTKKLDDQKCIERNLQLSLRDTKLDSVHLHKQISALRNYMQTLQDIKCITIGESLDIKDHANPIDAINIILNKWNSMYIEIIDNEIQLDEDPQESQINFDDSKFKKLFCIDDEFLKNDTFSNTSILGNNQSQYILPPLLNKSLLLKNTAVNSNSLQYEHKNKCYSSEVDNSFNYTTDKEFKFKTINENIPISEINDTKNNDEKENIASVKLIMRFSNNKTERDFDQKIFQNNCETDIESIDPKNILSNVLSTEITKIAQKINNTIETNKMSPKESETKIEKINLNSDYVINAINLLLKSDITLSKCSQDTILQNLIHSLDLLKRSSDEKYIIQKLQDLKRWLSCEPNDVILNRLKMCYYEIEAENQQIQELSEQLVILKEKYNTTMEEKASVIKKYINLEAQYRTFIKTNTVPIYYVAPIIFALIWMVLEKML